MIIIPSTDKKFLQTNRGNILGNLWATFGIDLQDNVGAIRVGNRMKVISKTGDANCANLGVATAFTIFGSKVACIAGTRIFFSNKLTPDMVFAEDTSTNARTDWNADTDDLCLFNGTLVGYNATQRKVYSLDTSTGGTWTQRATGYSGSNGRLLYFKKFNRLYLLDSNNIHSLDTSWNKSVNGNGYDIAFSNDNGGSIQCIEAGSDRIWIGMKHGASGGLSSDSSPAPTYSTFEWDGISNQVTKEYKTATNGVLAMTMRRDIPILIDTEGVLREYNGQGFVEIGRLPLRRNQSLLLTPANANFTQNFIHPRGLVISKDDTILALISNRTLFDYTTPGHLYENLPSGIWEFDGKGSATMRFPITLMPISSTSVTDHGQNRLSLIGSLANIKVTNISGYGISSLFAGAEIYSDATTTLDAIFMDAPWPTGLVTYPEGQKYGYFVTPFFQSQQVKENWDGAWLRYKQLLDSGDKIVVKYRWLNAEPIECSITWTSTTTFTTATDLTSYVGYEVEGIQGKGSGKCSHILSVTGSGTFTVTVDETYTGCTSGTARVRVQNWTRAGDVTNQTSESEQFNFGIISERCQVKVCMQFTGDDEVHQLTIINAVAQGFGGGVPKTNLQ